MSLRQIANFLSKIGVPTKRRGLRWHPEMVKRILSEANSFGLLCANSQHGSLMTAPSTESAYGDEAQNAKSVKDHKDSLLAENGFKAQIRNHLRNRDHKENSDSPCTIEPEADSSQEVKTR